MEGRFSPAFYVMEFWLEVQIVLWPVTLVLGAVALWAVFRLLRLGRLRARPTIVLFAVSLAVFVGLPIYSAMFWWSDPRATVQTQVVATYVLAAFICTYFAIAVFAVVVARGYRLPLTAVGSFLAWINAGVVLAAALGVSGAPVD